MASAPDQDDRATLLHLRRPSGVEDPRVPSLVDRYAPTEKTYFTLKPDASYVCRYVGPSDVKEPLTPNSCSTADTRGRGSGKEPASPKGSSCPEDSEPVPGEPATFGGKDPRDVRPFVPNGMWSSASSADGYRGARKRKTKYCRFWMNGYCRNEGTCSYAHGDREIVADTGVIMVEFTSTYYPPHYWA